MSLLSQHPGKHLNSSTLHFFPGKYPWEIRTADTLHPSGAHRKGKSSSGTAIWFITESRDCCLIHRNSVRGLGIGQNLFCPAPEAADANRFAMSHPPANCPASFPWDLPHTDLTLRPTKLRNTTKAITRTVMYKIEFCF